MIITYSECVFVALGIQREMRMSHIVVCGPFGCTIYFLSKLSHKRHDFQKPGSLSKKCVF